MKKNILTIIVIWLAMSSCIEKKNDLNPNEETIALKNDSIENCFYSEFYQCVYEYIQNTQDFLCEDAMYYSIYFFSKDSIDYFTIWTEYTPNEIRAEYNNQVINTIKINDIDVLVIGRKMYSNEQLYQYYDSLIVKDSIPNVFIYGKRMYIETYRYSLLNERYVLEKLDSPIIDFFED